jgi:hypothetical protein
MLNTLIESLCSLKREKKALEAKVGSVDEQIADVELRILEAMDAEGVILTKSPVGKVTVSESVYPAVEQWDQFYEFIHENKYFHLLERRPAVLAYRELLNLGRPVPGVLPFTKRKVLFRES